MRFDGKRVSREWHTVLTAARGDGVRFTLNSGRRTLAEQALLYATFLRVGRPLAAKPSRTAPHIRVGRLDHAVDINASDGGAQRFAGWMQDHGLRAAFTVPGEPWHIESTADDLKDFHELNGIAQDALRQRLRWAYAARVRQTSRVMVERMNRRIKAIRRRLRG